LLGYSAGPGTVNGPWVTFLYELTRGLLAAKQRWMNRLIQWT
jgi:hypothetical protein